MTVAVTHYNFGTWDINGGPFAIPALIKHQTLRTGRDAYLDGDKSARSFFAKAATSVNHIVRKGRLSWVIGGALRHGRKYHKPYSSPGGPT